MYNVLRMDHTLTIIVFGATGDLFQNKLAPALHELFVKKHLPEQFSIVGYGRKDMADEDFRVFVKSALDNKFKTTHTHESFLSHVRYVKGELDNVEDLKEIGIADVLYIALPPLLSETVLRALSQAGLAAANSRILIEKPFGQDQAHALTLDALTRELFAESQIFRVDHYLAKESVQNILEFRFAQGSLEEKWNKEYIEKVKIYIHEKITVKNRGALYDSLGALKDVGQNHILEMLAFVAMEKPSDSTAEAAQQARAAMLSSINVCKEKIVRGQYEGYLEEDGVVSSSQTETFFRVNLGIDMPRWEGILFEIESGKALSQSKVAVEIVFKNGTTKIFDISTLSKTDAYEQVFLAGINGDQSFFVGREEIMALWKVATDIINSWQSVPLVVYKEGTDASNIK